MSFVPLNVVECASVAFTRTSTCERSYAKYLAFSQEICDCSVPILLFILIFFFIRVFLLHLLPSGDCMTGTWCLTLHSKKKVSDPSDSIRQSHLGGGLDSTIQNS